MQRFAVGIDLGTTYSAVAVYRDKNSEICPNDQGSRTTPSCVAFTSSQRFVGEAAVTEAAENPENMIYGVKRLMGRKFTDVVIKRDIESWPFHVLEENGQIKIEVQDKRYFPEQISAFILEKLKDMAEEFLKDKIKDVVITCPAYFNNSQRQATKDAAKIAGLNVLRMINEPTAAAIAYGLNVNHVGRKTVLIFDFGGGTFDVSILTIKDKDYKVHATNGDTHLGGEDIDMLMVDHFVQEFKRKHNQDISGDKGLMFNLKRHCERSKKLLSTATKAEFVLEGVEEGVNLKGNISRARFEDLINELCEKTIRLVGETLKEAEKAKNEIDDVVLVGGSSRIPRIQELLSEFFDGKQLSHRINPDEAVAMGAAIQAGLLQTNVDNQLKGLKLCDVCPLSLSTRIANGSCVKIIKRNTSIPIKSSDKFYTVYDYQTAMNIDIYEGERVMAKDNHLVGKFTINGIASGLRGEVPVKLTYEIDDNGILTATAFDAITGANSAVTITNESRLSRVDASRLAEDAAKFREEDVMHETRLVAYNDFERYLYETKRKIRTLQPEAKQKQAKACIDEFINWLDDNSLATKGQFEAKKYELKEAWDRIEM